jgi:branched-chain amino acid transport system substrate-binding protein
MMTEGAVEERRGVRIVQTVCVALLFGVLVAACDFPPVRIGFVGELTGPYAELGEDGRDAVLLAVAEANAKGGIQGRPVEVVVRDAGATEAACAAAVDDVVSQGAVAVVGPMLSRHAQVVLAAMERHPEVLFFSPTMSTSLLSGRDDMLVRSIAKAEDEGALMASYAAQQGWLRIVAIQDTGNAAYTGDVVLGLRSAGGRWGVQVVQTVRYAGSQGCPADALAAEALTYQPQAVVLAANAPQTMALVRALRARKPDVPVLSSKWAQTPDVAAAPDMRGLVVVGNTWHAAPHLAPFKESFQRRYGRQPSYGAVWTYDCISILLDAMARAKSLEGAAIKEAILAVPVYQGLEREIRFDAFGDTLYDYQLLQVVDGFFRPVEGL